MTLKEESVEHLVKLAKEANDSDRWWEFAQGLEDEVPKDHGAAAPSSPTKDGSHDELQEIADRILDETGIQYTVDRLRQLRATAIAWPPEERDPEVEFAVHERLRGPKLKPKLALYKERAARDYARSPGFMGSPRLTKHRLAVYRREETPSRPLDEILARRVRGVLNKALSAAELDQIEAVFVRELRARRKQLP